MLFRTTPPGIRNQIPKQSLGATSVMGMDDRRPTKDHNWAQTTSYWGTDDRRPATGFRRPHSGRRNPVAVSPAAPDRMRWRSLGTRFWTCDGRPSQIWADDSRLAPKNGFAATASRVVGDPKVGDFNTCPGLGASW